MPLLRELTLGSYFATVADPRTARTRDHALLDIIVIALAAIICRRQLVSANCRPLWTSQ